MPADFVYVKGSNRCQLIEEHTCVGRHRSIHEGQQDDDLQGFDHSEDLGQADRQDYIDDNEDIGGDLRDFSTSEKIFLECDSALGQLSRKGAPQRTVFFWDLDTLLGDKQGFVVKIDDQSVWLYFNRDVKWVIELQLELHFRRSQICHIPAQCDFGGILHQSRVDLDSHDRLPD